jgi:HK97 family phage major capsid protein
MFPKLKSRVPYFEGPGGKQKAELCGDWIKAICGQQAARARCIERGVGLAKATTESTNVTGGFLAPQDFDAGIISVVEMMGAFPQGAEVRQSRSDGQVRPRRTGGLAANFVAEGAPIPESSLLMDAIEAALKKLGMLARFSTELLEDSAADVGSFLAFEMGYSIATKLDDVAFNGDGTSAFSGITGLGVKLVGLKSAVAASGGANTFLTITTTDIANLMGGVLATAIPGAAWYVSSTCYAQTICRLAAISGGLVATQRADGRIDANFLGFPVRFSGKLPDVPFTNLIGKPMMFFGDLSKSSVLVERQQQLVLAISHDRALDTNQVLIRGVKRCDVINHSVGDSNVRGPIAMLVGTT